jgi:hypothetical protein
MDKDRRMFLKTTALTSATVGVAMAATPRFESSNGVVVGKSPKQEILYKKTSNWEDYYKSAQ